MTTLYKLTDEKGQAKNGTQWGPGITHIALGNPNQDLCSGGWIHAYEHPLIAVFLNSIHGNFKNPLMWECAGVVEKREGQRKCGCHSLTTVKEIELPKISATQKIAFCILCVKTHCKDQKWNLWADKWLSGEDRTENSAVNAAYDAYYAAYDAYYATYAAAAYADDAYYDDYVDSAYDDAAYYAANANANAAVNIFEIAEKAVRNY